MFERPRAGERAVLVRLGIGQPRRARGSRRVRAARALRRARCRWRPSRGRRDRPDPRYFVGSGKAEEIARRAREHESAMLILVDHPLSPEPGAQSREAHRPPSAGSQRADPRHLCAARAQLRRQARSRARAAQAPRQPPGARLDPPRAAEGRHRPARPRRDAARNRPPAARQARPLADCAPRESQAAARHRPQRARRDPGSGRRAGRLHQRRQIDAVPRR